MIKIEMKNRWTGDILFEYEKESNTIKDTIEEALRKGADLRGADLSGAYLRCANLSDAKNLSVPLSCPSEGSFIGWKKVRNENLQFLVKLEVPDDAKRSSATTAKCRCSKAKVLSIIDINNGNEVQEVMNYNEKPLLYKVGEMVFPDSYNEDRWNECSHGIHFFVDKDAAINY